MGKQLAFVHQDLERYHGFVRMKVIGGKTMVKTSATSDIRRLTKSPKGGVTWIRRCCKGMCSAWLISENHAYATAALLRCPRALTPIAPFSEPGKLAFLWFCYGNYGNHRINKARVRYVACITL